MRRRSNSKMKIRKSSLKKSSGTVENSPKKKSKKSSFIKNYLNRNSLRMQAEVQSGFRVENKNMVDSNSAMNSNEESWFYNVFEYSGKHSNQSSIFISWSGSSTFFSLSQSSFHWNLRAFRQDLESISWTLRLKMAKIIA